MKCQENYHFESSAVTHELLLPGFALEELLLVGVFMFYLPFGETSCSVLNKNIPVSQRSRPLRA